jgi:hypothetical protein
MCPDDVRALEELNPIPNGEGKVFWRSANLLPLAQLEAPSQMSSGKGAADDQQGNADDASNDGSGGDAGSKAQASAAMRGRLELLATGSADRCVRKEVGAVRKMIERKAGVYEVTEFYREHARFIAEVFHMEAAAALTVMIACDARAQELSALLGDEDDEFQAGAQVWVENLAATLPKKLVALAVEGVR